MYTALGTTNNLQTLVEEHAGLVKRIAHHLMARLPDTVQLDDLIQAGMVGLLEAARNFDHSKGAAFSTFAGIRIRGAMLDEVRRGDWIPRSVHRNARRVSEAIRQLEIEHGRQPTDNEVAQALSLSLDEYHAFLQDSKGARLFSLDELLEENGQDVVVPEIDNATPATLSPSRGVEQGRLHDNLVEAIKTLPEREQLVLSLYYDEELNLKEIGAVLGVSESRVSQIHSQAASRLRAKLADWQAN
ncbi:RNA polymerase sigma factor FliA [Salinibius halmophilus]|uniref:RNA polymerase sigma factor FliA n=1 Tax=Salinibius halmophilus TaxID=1853216 RepID=UPI000E6634A9|nr:RNA polymerase sigma factor FliA [Salinibius halmophilus]